MSQTGLGPCIGELFFVAPNDSSSSHYRDALGDVADGIYTTVTAAYNAATANRNDIIFVAPGAYDEGASIDWTKDNTHLIGLGGPVTKADYSEKNVVIYTDTTTIDYTIDLTGDHCQFINIGINNAGNDATNYAAMRVNGYGNLFRNVTFIGNLGANQLAAAACGSLAIAANGHNCLFENCIIGEDCWGLRSAADSAQLMCVGETNGVRFIDCDFRSYSTTATVAMVNITGNGMGRDWLFKRCQFNNYSAWNSITNRNQVFATVGTGKWTQLTLVDCHANGFDRWTDSASPVYGTMPIADDGGGLSISLVHTVAGGA